MIIRKIPKEASACIESHWLDWLDRPMTMTSFGSWLCQPASRCYYAVVEGASNEFCLALILISVAGNEAEVVDWGVAPGHRGNGFGSQVFKELVEQLISEGLSSLFLEVRESNVAAISIYQKLKFQPIGRRPAYYQHPKEDAIVMKRVLP